MKKTLLIIIGVSISYAMTAQITKAAPTKTASTGIGNQGEAGTAPGTALTTVTEQIEIKPAYVEKEAVLPTFATVTEQMLVKEAWRVGGSFTTVTEQIMVRAETRRLEVTPIAWESYQKMVAIEKPCKGTPKLISIAAQRILTAAVVHTIVVPAEYMVIEKQLVNVPGQGEQMPAEYRTITKTVLQAPAQIREIEMPATFKAVKVKKCSLGNN
jgi:hypothetical protein